MIFSVVWLPLLLAGAQTIQNPEEFASILVGTDTRSEWSNGNVIPMVGTPWGHTYWAPETDLNDGGSWWFHPSAGRLIGLRCTHQPSPWIGDWGWFRMQFGFDDNGWARENGWDIKTADLSPYHFGSELLGISSVGNETTGEGAGNARVDLSVTNQAAHVLLTFPVKDNTTKNQKRRVWFERRDQLRPCNKDDWTVTYDTENQKTIVTGFTTSYNGPKPWDDGWNDEMNNDSIPRGVREKYALYFHAEFNATSERSNHWTDGEYNDIMTVLFSEDVVELDVKIGVSLIHPQIAEAAVGSELYATWNETMMANKEVWRQTLSVVDVVDSGYTEEDEEEALRTYYSNLYRTALFPNNLQENNGQHWSPFDGGIYEGPLSTDSGFWDAYHTVYSLMAILWPDQVNVAMQGYVNAFIEGGWHPQWSAPGYKGSMVGTMSDVSAADMIIKGFDFNTTAAMEAMKKNAFTAPDIRSVGRRGLAYLDSHGFVPRGAEDQMGDVHEVTSRTLNHAFADFAILQAEAYLQTEIFSNEQLMRLNTRSQNWKNIFNTTSRFFQSKLEDGTWAEPFDEYLWGGDWTEGSAWQFRFYAPHHYNELAELYGGVEELCLKVDEMNTHPSYFHRAAANYGSPIHEMLELQLNVWGQNSHNNQPTHHAQYMPLACASSRSDLKGKCHDRATYWIKKTMTQLYTPTRYSGDEDNGEMSGWLILSSFGFYPMTPSTNEFILGVPLFREIHIQPNGRSSLQIKAPKNCKTCSQVNEISYGGIALSGTKFMWNQIVAGGNLTFHMGDDYLEMGIAPAGMTKKLIRGGL
eukprot:GHVP01029561.1.p1 GENE.GHVP01029561.1~~GHVP01029561.1.p1  ORF type:complete len:807 (+),score=129.12 GHVP01029561.1:35-2455(+)